MEQYELPLSRRRRRGLPTYLKLQPHRCFFHNLHLSVQKKITTHYLFDNTVDFQRGS